MPVNQLIALIRHIEEEHNFFKRILIRLLDIPEENE